MNDDWLRTMEGLTADLMADVERRRGHVDKRIESVVDKLLEELLGAIDDRNAIVAFALSRMMCGAIDALEEAGRNLPGARGKIR